MFAQYLADGGNLFIAIVAGVFGFVAALAYVDYLRTQRKQKEKQEEG